MNTGRKTHINKDLIPEAHKSRLFNLEQTHNIKSRIKVSIFILQLGKFC